MKNVFCYYVDNQTFFNLLLIFLDFFFLCLFCGEINQHPKVCAVFCCCSFQGLESLQDRCLFYCICQGSVNAITKRKYLRIYRMCKRTDLFAKIFKSSRLKPQSLMEENLRKRINTEEKAKVVAAVWGGGRIYSIPCRARYFAQDDFEEKDEFILFFSDHPGAIHPIQYPIQNRPRLNGCIYPSSMRKTQPINLEIRLQFFLARQPAIYCILRQVAADKLEIFVH